MLRNALLGFSILFLTSVSCTDPEKPSGGSITINPDLVGVAKAEVDLTQAFPELVEKARAELSAASGLDLTDLEFKLVDSDKILETFYANVSIQNVEDLEDQDSESLSDIARGMIGVYSIEEGQVFVSLENYQWLTKVMEMPDYFNQDILFGVIAHEGGHAVADRKYDLRKLIEGCATSSELLAAGAVIEGYAQQLARQVCAKTGTQSGLDGLTELITTVPDLEDPLEKMMIAVMVQQFSFSYVEGEAFLNAVKTARGEEGLAQVFAEPPTSRNYVTHPDWYLDPSNRPGSDYQVDVALDVFDEFFADKEWANQRIDFDEGLLRTAAAALPAEDVDKYAGAVIQSRLTMGSSEGGMQNGFVVCALHHCQDDDHAVLFVGLSEQLIVAKEEMMKDSVTSIESSELQEVEKPGFSGFQIQQTVEASGVTMETMTVQVVKDDLVCEITLVQVDMPMEELLNLAFDILNKATE